IWLIDRHAATVAHDMVYDLGDWLRCRLKKGVQEQGSIAQEVLDQCTLGASELWKQWSDQWSAQLSIRAHVPAHLKKELDTVLALQAELNGSKRVLQAVWAIVEKGPVSQGAHDALASLERGHERLLNKVDTLYSSLNVHDRFPELDGVNFEFVQILLLARDLKINIQKRAIGSFFEWDKLDRAVSGKQKVLGKCFWS
ncbi:hypothetical protein SCLCIDRAFT_124951, partial [Scleroderma citrinum Foug A]